MEFVSIAQLLARRWVFVAAGAVLAILAGLAAAGTLPFGPQASDAADSGLAESKVLVDTASSYANDLEGGTEVLGAQAALLATLIADRRQRESIAREVGIAPAELDVVVSEITQPKIPSTLARSLASAVDKPRSLHAITVRADSSVSIITLEASAPSRDAAARLARAGTAALAGITAASAPSPRRSLVIKPLGEVRSIAVPSSGQRGPLLGVAVAIALLGMWCCAIVVLSGLARAWRSAAPAPVRHPTGTAAPR